MFHDPAGYLDFLRSLELDFHGIKSWRRGRNEAVAAVGKSAAFMYKRFLESCPEMAQLPVFIVLPHGSDTFGIPEERIFRPSVWAAFGMDAEGADYRACASLGPLYR